MDRNSEEWRLDCEIRHIASMGKDQRAVWWVAIEKHRGRPAMLKLMDQVNAYRRASFAATGSASCSDDTAARTATESG